MAGSRSSVLAALVLGVVACSAGSATSNAPDPSASAEQVDEQSASLKSPMHGRNVAEPDLVLFGDYEDWRFLDMMAAHHAMAVEHAKVAVARAQHEELRAMAQQIIDSQTVEIEEIRSIKREEYGIAHVPLEMNPHQTNNMGTLTTSQLEAAKAFDLAFIDDMIPHHAGAVTMASVARLRSANSRILAMARSIIDAQSEEIGKMIAMRKEWYPSAP